MTKRKAPARQTPASPAKGSPRPRRPNGTTSAAKGGEFVPVAATPAARGFEFGRRAATSSAKSGEFGRRAATSAAKGGARAGAAAAAVDSGEPEALLDHVAFEALRPEIEGLAAGEVLPARVDVQRAAAVARSVAERDASRPERRAEFARLAAAGFYDLGLLGRLPRLAQAAWYARQQQSMNAAIGSSARVPEPIMREARRLRGAMLRVLDYWVADDEAVARELARLRSGGGHQDLAGDLNGLALLYERRDVRDVIAADVRHYRAADAGDARRLSLAIFEGLGLRGGGEAKRWQGLTHRAWTLLFRAYEDHRAAGAFVFRRREDVSATYPSLVSSVRSAPARRPAGGGGRGADAG